MYSFLSMTTVELLLSARVAFPQIEDHSQIVWGHRWGIVLFQILLPSPAVVLWSGHPGLWQSLQCWL